MKILNKIFPLVLLSLFVLTACSGTPSDSSTTRMPAAQEAPADETAPVSMYGTKMNCNMLKNTEQRQNCEMQMNDMIGGMLEAEIVSAFDISRCRELPGEIGTRCQEHLNATGVQGPVRAEEIELYKTILRGTFDENLEMPSVIYDAVPCAELKTTGYREYCESQVAVRIDQNKFHEIISSNNKNLCDELITETFRDDCRQFFGEGITEEMIVPAEVTETIPEEPVMEVMED